MLKENELLKQHNINDTKSRIFLAAADLFAKFGYDRVSVRQICEAANVSKPSLYYYFEDKDSLLYELFFESHRVAEELFKKTIESGTSFEKRFEGLFKGFGMFLKSYPTFIRFFIQFFFMAIPQKVKEMKLQRGKEQLVLVINFFDEGKKTGYLKPDIDTEILSAAVLGSINQIVFQHIVNGNIENVQDTLDQMCEFWKNQLQITTNTHGVTKDEN